MIHFKIKTIIFLFPLFTVLIAAQTEKSELSVKGTASMAVAPTETGINIILESTGDTYSRAISDLIYRVKILNENLDDAGIKPGEKFTSGFNIRKNMVYENNRQTQKGYAATQSVLVRIKLDMERLIKIINSITQNDAKPEIQISFTVDKKTLEEKQNELIKMAVKDAAKKAEIIALESGYSISGIKYANYGVQQPGILRNSYDMMAESKMGFSSGDMNAPANIIINDAVEIIYYIDKN